MHAKLQARASSREHAPVLTGARFSQVFFWPGWIKILREVVRDGKLTECLLKRASCKAHTSLVCRTHASLMLYDLQIFSDKVYHLKQPRAQTLCLLPMHFGISLT